MNSVTTKLSAARTKLILDKPFLGALVLRLPLVESTGNWCTTSATDARSLYYNASYIEPLSLSQVQFVLAHEALHCGLAHFARRNHRNINRWNVACDYAVNQLLVEDGLELPPGALFNEQYKGLSAEEIYPLMDKESEEQTMDQHLYDAQPERTAEQDIGQREQPDQHQDDEPAPQKSQSKAKHPNIESTMESGKETDINTNSEISWEYDSTNNRQQQRAPLSHQNTSHAPILNSETGSRPTESADTSSPKPLSASERARLNTQWQQRLAGAAQQAVVAGKMNGSVARMIDRFLRSSVPWRTLLARYMSCLSRTDYNFVRPSQRRGGDAILPSLHSHQTNVLIALDTSGSIEQEELNEFVSEVNAIKASVNARITLIACDTELDEDGPWEYECWEALTLPKKLKGNGGTDFVPVFNWMQACATPPDLLIYFTDAKGRFPQHAPNTETLWLIKGSADIPWGQRIQLN